VSTMEAYLYDADIYCADCAADIKQGLKPNCKHYRDESQYPVGPYLDGGGEADGPQYCGNCHIHLCNPLTTDGYRVLLQDYLDFLSRLANSTLRSTDHRIEEAWEFYCSSTTPYTLGRALGAQVIHGLLSRENMG